MAFGYPGTNWSQSANPLGAYGLNAQYSQSPFQSRSTGIPTLDMLMMAKLGGSMTPMPAPNSSQSIFDAFQLRQRSIDFLGLRQRAFAESLLFQKFGGINQRSPFFQIAAPFLSDPDGIAMRIMSPLIGGNPVKAQMGLYANLSGMTMGSFGRTQSIGGAEAGSLFDAVNRNFYNSQILDQRFLQGNRRAILTQHPDLAGVFTAGGGINNGAYNNVISQANAASDLGRILAGGGTASSKNTAMALALTGVTDQEAKRKLTDAFAESLKNGGDKAQEMFRNKVKPEDLERRAAALEQHQRYVTSQGQSIATDINFRKSYGFNMEDLTGGFTTAAKFNLLGKGALDTKLGNFMNKSGGRAMAAARDLFGNGLSGEDLVKQVSNLLGNSTYDMSDTGSSQKLEELLRNVKSAARTAGVSIDTILGIIEQGKALASQTPGLEGLSGAHMVGIAVHASDRATAFSAIASDQEIRRLGGREGVMQRLAAGQLYSASQPISQWYGALHNYFGDRPDIQKMIGAHVANPGTMFNYGNFDKFVNRVAGVSGINASFLRQYTQNSKMGAQFGLRDAPELARAGLQANLQVLAQQVFAGAGSSLEGRDRVSALFTELSSRGVDVEKYLNPNNGFVDQDVISQRLASAYKSSGNETYKAQLQYRLNRRLNGGFSLSGQAVGNGSRDLEQFETTKTRNIAGASRYVSGELGQALLEGIDSNMLDVSGLMANPHFNRLVAKVAQERKGQTLFETEMSSRYSHLYAPSTTQFFNQLLSGAVKDQGLFEGLLAPLGIGGTSAMKNTMIKKATGLNAALSSGNIADFITGFGQFAEGGILGDITGSDISGLMDISKGIGLENLGPGGSGWSKITNSDERKKAIRALEVARRLGVGDHNGALSLKNLQKGLSSVSQEALKEEFLVSQFKGEINNRFTTGLTGIEGEYKNIVGSGRDGTGTMAAALKSIDALRQDSTMFKGGKFDVEAIKDLLTGTGEGNKNKLLQIAQRMGITATADELSATADGSTIPNDKFYSRVRGRLGKDLQGLPEKYAQQLAELRKKVMGEGGPGTTDAILTKIWKSISGEGGEDSLAAILRGVGEIIQAAANGR